MATSDEKNIADLTVGVIQNLVGVTVSGTAVKSPNAPNALTADKLKTPRTISASADSDLTMINGSFDGSANITPKFTLKDTAVTAGTYSNITVNAKGLITAARAINSADITTGLGFTPAPVNSPRLGVRIDLDATNLSASFRDDGSGNLAWYVGDADALDGQQVKSVTLNRLTGQFTFETSPFSQSALDAAFRARTTGADKAAFLGLGDATSDLGAVVLLAGASYTGFGGGNSLNVWNIRSGPLTFGSANSERMRILADGKVAIGLTAASTLLHIGGTVTINGDLVKQSDATVMRVYGGSAFDAGSGILLYGKDHATDPNKIVFTNGANVTRAVLDSAGNLGIGTSSASARLHVRPTTNVNLEVGTVSSALRFEAYNDARNSYIPFRVQASTILLNPAGGNVAIGGATAAAELEVHAGGGDEDCRIQVRSNATKVAQFGRSSTLTFIDCGVTDPFAIYVNGVSRFEISGAGVASFPGGVTLPANATATTQTLGDNSTKPATTAFVQAAIAAGASIEPGIIGHTAGSSPPTGWLERNGAAISRTTYAALFAKIGTTFGVGDGSTTFNLPDDRANVDRGWDNGRGIDVGRVRGSEQLDAFQGHAHTVWVPNAQVTSNFTVDGTGLAGVAVMTTDSIVSDGANGTPRVASETRMRNRAHMPIIKF